MACIEQPFRLFTFMGLAPPTDSPGGGQAEAACSLKVNAMVKHWPENVGLPLQHMEIVTLMPKLPFSAKSCAMLVSKTRQSLFMMAVAIPS